MGYSKRVSGIAKDALRLILEACKSTHPNEFAGLLRSDGRLITEVLLVPGTTSDEGSARMLLDMMPLDISIVGSVHSHPVHDLRFSEADICMFGAKGYYNIIVAYPYTEMDWACYNPSGERVNLPVVEA
ncbi:Mov34/MPN/PAD-1 family protein [Methanocella conradii]|uniref:Mov34/MPN/PAD-1 family protein n=1 Tax=Methanocella conradii TaxID=1175444 RepID=UPI00157C63FD|nr:Mov34/MPN/PAD-1 family protein [Methanocella conradii]